MIYSFKTAIKWYNNMRIGFTTLENMALDIKSILILHL